MSFLEPLTRRLHESGNLSPVRRQESHVRYAFLIYNDESTSPEPGSAELNERVAAYAAFTEEVQKSGAWQAGEALQNTATATVVRADSGGSPLTTDGPYAETKEQLAGFYILECKDLDEAVELAAKIPAATHGSVEVRPIWDVR
jgi:hypothetical protein